MMAETDDEKPLGRVARFVHLLAWTPPWLRWDGEANHELTWGLVVIFGFVCFGLDYLFS